MRAENTIKYAETGNKNNIKVMCVCVLSALLYIFFVLLNHTHTVHETICNCSFIASTPARKVKGLSVVVVGHALYILWVPRCHNKRRGGSALNRARAQVSFAAQTFSFLLTVERSLARAFAVGRPQENIVPPIFFLPRKLSPFYVCVF